MFNESGAVQAVEVVGGPTSEENKDIAVRTLCVCVCVCVCTNMKLCHATSECARLFMRN